jgi:hypothetical protein
MRSGSTPSQRVTSLAVKRDCTRIRRAVAAVVRNGPCSVARIFGSGCGKANGAASCTVATAGAALRRKVPFQGNQTTSASAGTRRRTATQPSSGSAPIAASSAARRGKRSRTTSVQRKPGARTARLSTARA